MSELSDASVLATWAGATTGQGTDVFRNVLTLFPNQTPQLLLANFVDTGTSANDFVSTDNSFELRVNGNDRDLTLV